MIIQLLLSVLLVVAFALFQKCYIHPRKQIAEYKKLFEEKGYKVYAFTYKMMTYPIIQTIYKDSLKGDAFLTYKQQFNKYDVLIGNQLNKPSISLFHPELRKQFAKIERDFCMEKLKDFTKQQARFAGYGLIFSEGEDWKRKRRTMGSLFTFQLIKDNIPNMVSICENKITKFAGQNFLKEDYIYRFQLGQFASSIFSEIIISVFLGLKTVGQTIDGIPMGKFILELANDANMQAKGLMSLIFGIKHLDWGITQKDRNINKRLKSFEKWVNEFIENEIKIHLNSKQKIQTKDILTIHLQKDLQKSNKITLEDKNLYKKEELISELKNFAIAGTDTSVNFFRMMVFYLFKNPQVEQNLRKQISQVIGQNEITSERLKKMKYLEAIQKQTTRMYGPTNHNFPRKVINDYLLEGIPIRKNTIIQYHSIPTHYNPQIYENPQSFNPDRWMNKPDDEKVSAQLVGFGLGPRNCIGQFLASTQSKIAMIKFYQSFAKVDISEVEKIKMKWKFLYKPDNFYVRVKK